MFQLSRDGIGPGLGRSTVDPVTTAAIRKAVEYHALEGIVGT